MTQHIDIPPSPHALLNYYTTDIDASYQLVRPLQAPIIRGIERFDDFAYIIPTATF